MAPRGGSDVRGRRARLFRLGQDPCARGRTSRTAASTTSSRRPTFDEMLDADELLEWAPFVDHRSGTPRAVRRAALDAGTDVILEIDVEGRRAGTGDGPGRDPDLPRTAIAWTELERRLRGRGTEDDERIARRLETAAWEMTQRGWFDHVVVNDDVVRAADEVAAIIEASRTGRLPTALGHPEEILMIEPKIDDLLAAVDSKYTLVILAAKRAREINSYYSQLGEGRAEFIPPLIESGGLTQQAVVDRPRGDRRGEDRLRATRGARRRVAPRSPDDGCCSASRGASPHTRRGCWPGSWSRREPTSA